MGLVGDDRASGPSYGLEDRAHVERAQRAQVDHLERGAVGGSGLCGRHRGLHHRSVGEHGRVGAAADHPAGEQRLGGRRVVEVGLVGVVLALRLEEDHRVVGGDGLLDHPVAVDRVGAGDDLQARGVRELRLRALRVVLDRTDAATERDPDDHRHRRAALGAVVHLRDLAHDLVVRRVDEAVELDLHHGPVATQGHPDRRTDDAGLGQRRVDDPVLAEVLLQSVGDPEDATELADVLAHDQDLGVVLHRLAQPHVEALGEGDLLRSRAHDCTASKVSR